MSEKDWKDMTADEKANKLSSMLDGTINQVNQVFMNLHRRVDTLEARISQLEKGQ
jgi:hypothetical protein